MVVVVLLVDGVDAGGWVGNRNHGIVFIQYHETQLIKMNEACFIFLYIIAHTRAI